MAFEPHPWFIGLEGVEHSAETARMLAWAATSGASGIIKPTDLRVLAQPVPDGSVRLMPGGFVVESRYPEASCQSYVERAPDETTVEVPATGSSGGVVRYVVARIEDPDYEGEIPATPEEANARSYAAPYVVSSLSDSKTEIPLARIDQPANTGTITNSMITDLREVANPREKTVVLSRPNVTADTGMDLNSRSAYPDGEWFPNVGGQDNTGRYDIEVPSWATRMQVRCEWLSIRYRNNPGAGFYWVSYGAGGGSNDPTYYTQGFGWDSDDSTSTTNWLLEQDVNIHTDWRGNMLSFFPRANKTSDSSYPGTVKLTARSGMVLKVRFLEVAEM